MDVVEEWNAGPEAVALPNDEKAAAVPVSGRYWTLALLFLVGTISMVDKAFVQVLVDPIKHEFGLSDAQGGLLSGISFALFFAIAGIPLGIVADRYNRRNLITGCMAFWSLATALCGFAGSFIQLLSLRFLVGAGESGATPSALSMISDLFEPKKRATAVSVYYLFTPVGSGIALTVGALVAHAYGWRTTMMLAGVPGLILALIFLLTVREPRRVDAAGIADRASAPPVMETFRFILAQRALVHVIAAITLVTIAINGFGMWMYPFFTRVHHVPGADAGWQISVATYPASVVGMLTIGYLADRFAYRDVRWRVWLPAMLAFACLPAAFLAVTVDSTFLALVFTGAWMVGATSWYGAGYGVSQSLVHPRMRATLAAILLLLTTLLGFGLGPWLTGVISDTLAPSIGIRSVGYGMVATNVLAVWAGIHFLLAGRRLQADLDTAARHAAPTSPSHFLAPSLSAATGGRFCVTQKPPSAAGGGEG